MGSFLAVVESLKPVPIAQGDLQNFIGGSVDQGSASPGLAGMILFETFQVIQPCARCLHSKLKAMSDVQGDQVASIQIYESFGSEFLMSGVGEITFRNPISPSRYAGATANRKNNVGTKKLRVIVVVEAYTA